MIDTPLQELWTIKNNLAKQHNYDLDKLVDYLRKKYTSKINPQSPKNATNIDKKEHYVT
jgi:hypothetical protein